MYLKPAHPPGAVAADQLPPSSCQEYEKTSLELLVQLIVPLVAGFHMPGVQVVEVRAGVAGSVVSTFRTIQLDQGP